MLTKYSDGYIRTDSLTRYAPFGAYRTGGSNPITDRAFTGQRENMELGLYYYNARYYLPGVGRFVSADTIVPDPANPQSFNRYSYVYNNALRYIDPTGNFTEEQLQEWYPDDWEYWKQNFENFWQMLLAANFGDDVFYDFDPGTKSTFVEGDDGRAYVIGNSNGNPFSLDGKFQPLWGGVPLKHVRSYAYTLSGFSSTGKVNVEQFGVLSWRRFCKGPTCYTREKYISYYNEFSIPTIRENWNDASGLMADATELTVDVSLMLAGRILPKVAPRIVPYIGVALFFGDALSIGSELTTVTAIATHRYLDLSTAPSNWR